VALLVTMAESVGNILAHLPGNLVWDCIADLSGDILASLPWDIPAHLLGDIIAHLFGEWDGHLPGHLVAHLPWNCIAHLPGDGVADLPGDGVADSLGDGSGGVNALGVRNWEAPGLRHQTGVLDWPLVADTLDLGVAPGGRVGDGSKSDSHWSSDVLGFSLSLGLGIGFGLSFGITLVLLDWVGKGGQRSNGWDASNCGSLEGQWSSIQLGEWGWNGSGNCRGSSKWYRGTNNGLDSNIAVNSNQGSLLAVLCLDVMALVNDGSLNNWDRFGDALLAGGGGTLPVRHLTDNWVADLLGDSVADLFGNGVANLLGDSVADVVVLGPGSGLSDVMADLFWDGGALGVRDGCAHSLGDSVALLGGGHVPDSLADGVSLRLVLVGVGSGVGPGMSPSVSSVASIAVSTPVASVIFAVVSRGISFRLTQGQWCNKAQKHQVLIHF